MRESYLYRRGLAEVAFASKCHRSSRAIQARSCSKEAVRRDCPGEVMERKLHRPQALLISGAVQRAMSGELPVASPRQLLHVTLISAGKRSTSMFRVQGSETVAKWKEGFALPIDLVTSTQAIFARKRSGKRYTAIGPGGGSAASQTADCSH